MGPSMRGSSFDIETMSDEHGNSIDAANPNSRVVMDLPQAAVPYDLLRVSR
jgi:hypothetical protein